VKTAQGICKKNSRTRGKEIRRKEIIMVVKVIGSGDLGLIFFRTAGFVNGRGAMQRLRSAPPTKPPICAAFAIFGDSIPMTTTAAMFLKIYRLVIRM